MRIMRITTHVNQKKPSNHCDLGDLAYLSAKRLKKSSMTEFKRVVCRFRFKYFGGGDKVHVPIE